MSEPSDRIADVMADLSGQLDAAEAAELAAEVEDRTRREAALVSLVDRLRASETMRISVDTAAGPITGDLREVGSDWLRLEEGTGRFAVIPIPAVRTVRGLGRAATPPGAAGSVAERLDLRYLLRELARDRTAVRISLDDRRQLSGTLAQVGADYVELAEHAEGERRGPGEMSGTRAVRLAAMVALRVG